MEDEKSAFALDAVLVCIQVSNKYLICSVSKIVKRKTCLSNANKKLIPDTFF